MIIDDKVQCAGGGGCAQKEKCLRYRNRSHHSWASFDIERARLAPNDPCIHRVWFFKKPT